MNLMTVSDKGNGNCALSVSNLSAGYGSRVVLNDISFSVSAGETYGLIGLNGVGKTTLIKIILGLKSPLKGGVRLFGQSTEESSSRSFAAYLPERFDPPWFLSGGEFIAFASSLYGRTVKAEDMASACTKLALDPSVLKNRVQTYSKGMRQKLGLIATVLTGCPLLILDEPMSGLDPLARALVKNLLTAVKAEGRTIILSSHILADMDEICDRVTVVDSMTAPFTGTPHDMKVRSGEVSLEKAFLKIIGRSAESFANPPE